VSLLRWLGTLACLCFVALPVQAQPTVSTFSGAPTDTNYTYYSTQQALDGMVMNDGPAHATNYFRLTYAGVGSTNNEIAFDQTDTHHVTNLEADFDFRIGGTAGAGNYADGLGFALLPFSVYGATGNGLNGASPLPGITEEGDGAGDGAISFGLDTFNNGFPSDPDNNHVSVHYNSATTAFNYAVSLTPFNYQLHQDNLDDTATAFDHFHLSLSIDPNSGAATVTVTITSNQVGNTGENGTTLAPGTSFTPIKGLVIPGVGVYPMRVAFGARTGGANDNTDIANVNFVFTP
jgi:Legume lectin domain